MFLEFSAWSWVSGSILVAIGGVLGYFIARQIKDKRTRQLEEDLLASRKELAGYKQDVNRHFLKTSLLFNKLTDDYREVYEHLAKGAQTLCNDTLRSNLERLPDQDILPAPAAEQAINDSGEASTNTADPVSTAEDIENPQDHIEQVSREEKILLVTEMNDNEEDVPLGEESAPAIDIHHKTNRSIH